MRDHDPIRQAAVAVVCAFAALALTLPLAGCGGGSGITTPKAGVPDGVNGSLLLQDVDLGLVAEQEPNHVPGQRHRLPPLGLRNALAVAGFLAETEAASGATDTRDELTLRFLADQAVELTLDYAEADAVAVGTNEITLTVIDVETGTVIASAADVTPPHTATFQVTARKDYAVRLDLVSGHPSYRLDVVAGGGPNVAKPTFGSSPGAATATGAPAADPHQVVPLATRGLPRCADDHVLVGLVEGCDVEAFCAARGLQRGRRLGGGGWCVHFDTPPGVDGEEHAAALAASLAKDPHVAWAEPDYVVHALAQPSDPLWPLQWSPRLVGAPAAWDVTRGSPSIVVGVVDTGINEHPDLVGKTVPGYDFVSDADFSGDGDGRDPDPTDEGDLLAPSGFSTWHGMHVTGLIVGAHDNGQGIAGLAPDCRVMPLRAIGLRRGLASDAADAILFGAGQLITGDGRQLPAPLRVINLSLGVSEDSFVLRDSCERAANVGVLLVAAAGNDGGAVLFPARYPSVFCVGATDARPFVTTYSNRGPEVDLVAPGGTSSRDNWCDGWIEAVLSTMCDETVFPRRNDYGRYVGTSFAAPQVAAAAALLLSVDPTLNVPQLRQILTGSARDLGLPGHDIAHGWGILRIHEALKLVQASPTPAQLYLPTSAVRFPELIISRTVPLENAGGGRVEIQSAEASDGWLTASLREAPTPGGPVSHDVLTLDVDRSLLPDEPGNAHGYVVLRDAGGDAMARIDVVVDVQMFWRAGRILRALVIDAASDNSFAPSSDVVRPEFDYRYWMRDMPLGSYLVRGGEDLDGDGLSCEGVERCGFHGGPTEEDAVAVPLSPLENATGPLDVVLFPQAP